MTQHGTSNFTDERLDWLHDNQERAYKRVTAFLEGNTTHYYGVTPTGKITPLELDQARQARRSGVVGEFGATRPLGKDGE